MKVLFYEPYAIAKPHFEEALELMQVHLDKGDDVTLHYCSGNLSICEGNQKHNLHTCIDCIGRRLSGTGLLTFPKKLFKAQNFEHLNDEQIKYIRDWSIKFKSINEVKTFEVDGVDIGMSVASSLISYLRDAEPDLIKYEQLLNKIIKSSLSVYFSYKNYFSINKPDLVYLFNGRLSNLRPVLRLCEINKINYVVHERGSSVNKYGLFYNHLPHSPQAIQERMLSHWASEKDEELKIEIANQFFKDRRAGIELSGRAIFKSEDGAQDLPENWDVSKKNLVIFNSSDDEFAAVGREFFNPEFGKQINVLRYIKETLKNNNSIHVYLRMHPNMKGMTEEAIQDIKELAGSNFFIIPPESAINSYKLMDLSNIVITFGSTTGVEAVYSEKPSILIGNSMYRNLNITYNPETLQELSNLLVQDLMKKDKIGAYIYAFYRATFGISFKYYEPVSFIEGKFKGKLVESDYIYKKYFKYRFARMILSPIFYKKPIGG